ncbi:MAG TPA: glycerol-3-phosphate 1-O-acyltransferase PlsY [Steroidobacteraceae bacterium]|nr:glycerol-3-phosphate 1-O-acyltransferase PlsY [Steroidobacteraceae bacterium]
MLELGVKALIAYLAGSLLGSLLLGRLKGVDIRRLGSGNAGATNAMRTQGILFGLGVFAFDLLKGVLVVRALPPLALPGIGIDPELGREWLTLACALAVIVGHIFPVWFGFRGGKGVATLIGAVGAINPVLLGPMLGCWIGVVLLTGYVGLASILSGLALVLFVMLTRAADAPLLAFCALAELLMLYTHRGNIARMFSGSEHRARRLWLFRSRAA